MLHLPVPQLRQICHLSAVIHNNTDSVNAVLQPFSIGLRNTTQHDVNTGNNSTICGSSMGDGSILVITERRVGRSVQYWDRGTWLGLRCDRLLKEGI